MGSAGVRVRTSSKVCTMCTPSCLPAPPAHFTQRRSSCKAGADHQARWAGAWGGRGPVPGAPERWGEDVDLRWWRGWRCLGERERRWRGLGMEDGYGWRGERGGEVDMGRRWPAWWHPGEREWWWQGLGVVDGYGWRGERGAWRGLWGEGEVDVGRRWRAWRRRGGRERWWRGLGVGVLYGRRGEGGVDMGRRWRSWWRPGERERRERGLGGSWWHPGERVRREWVVEARWRCGVRVRRGRVCSAGEELERGRLRDRASSLESGQSGGVGGSWGASRGGAWYSGGGGRPWICHVGVWWRGLGVGVLYGRRGEGEVDMGRRWRSSWRPGERERQERGLRGSWWHPGEQERREWVVEARWRCGECGRRGRVCRAGGERERRRLRDRASSLESGQSGGVGGSWEASRGAAWYWGGGSPVVHGSAT